MRLKSDANSLWAVEPTKIVSYTPDCLGIQVVYGRCPASLTGSMKIISLNPAACITVNRRCRRIVLIRGSASESNLAILIAK